MVKIPNIIDMLKSGMHFGHQISKWHPKMAQYIFTQKNGVHILDLQITEKKIKEALDYITDVSKKGGTILMVGTKAQSKAIVKEKAVECNAPYITERWIGGLLTNFKVVNKLGKKLKTLKKKMETGELNKYTKKEQLSFQKEILNLEKIADGIKDLEKIPDAIFLVDVKYEKTALMEASKKGVPVIAICDTNVNPSKVDYVIPANDDAVKSLQMIISLVSEAIKEGKKAQTIESV